MGLLTCEAVSEIRGSGVGSFHTKGWETWMAKRKGTAKKTLESLRKKAKKGIAIQKKTRKTRSVSPTQDKAATKKTTGKKAVKKKSVKKKAAKVLAGRKKVKKKKTHVKVSREEGPGLPLKEIRARLGLIVPQFAALSSLDGIYLYGAELLEEPRLEHVNFIVVYRSLRSAVRLKAAEAELRILITAVLPVEFNLDTGTPTIGRLLGEGNPAVQAHLGYSEPVFARGV